MEHLTDELLLLSDLAGRPGSILCARAELDRLSTIQT